MIDCEHFGKTSEELNAELGLAWILSHCDGCPNEQACCIEAIEKEHERQLSGGKE